LSRPLIADTGGLFRALARKPTGTPSFPDYEAALTSASIVIVPALVLAEVDHFLREERAAKRKLIAEIFDPATRYEYELTLPSDGRVHRQQRWPAGTSRCDVRARVEDADSGRKRRYAR
jgi:hypothetical protein